MVAVWVAVQIVYVHNIHQIDIGSDPMAYLLLAKSSMAQGYDWYPNQLALHSWYVFNPGIVNILIGWLRLGGSSHGLMYVYILLNVITLVSGCTLCRRLGFGRRTAFVFAYLYMLMTAPVLMLNAPYSEPPMICLCMLGCLAAVIAAVKRACWSRAALFFLAGVVLGIAFWIRPHSMAWMVAVCVYLVMRRDYVRGPLAVMCGVASLLALVAVNTHRSFPTYNFSATTTGVNLLMAADRTSTGTYYAEAFSAGHPGYVGDLEAEVDTLSFMHALPHQSVRHTVRTSGLTYAQYDSLFRSRALQEIAAAPGHYIRQTPRRWAYLFTPVNAFLFPEGPYGFTPEQTRIYKYAGKVRFLLDRYLMRPVIWLFWLGFIPFVSWRSARTLFVALPVLVATCATLPFVTLYRYSVIMHPWMCLGVAVLAVWVWGQLSGRVKRRATMS